jgi:hypothetical protein
VSPVRYGQEPEDVREDENAPVEDELIERRRAEEAGHPRGDGTDAIDNIGPPPQGADATDATDTVDPEPAEDGRAW